MSAWTLAWTLSLHIWLGTLAWSIDLYVGLVESVLGFHSRTRTCPLVTRSRNVTKNASGGTFSLTERNLKKRISWAGWGAYRLSNASLSGVDRLGGHRVIREKEVPT